MRGPSLDGGSLSPVKYRPRNPRGRLSPSLTLPALSTFRQTGLFSPLIADADHRALAAGHNPDKMPNTCHPRGHSGAGGQLDLTLGPHGNTRRRKILSKARSSASISAVGAVSAPAITNLRPLVLLPLQQTMLPPP